VQMLVAYSHSRRSAFSGAANTPRLQFGECHDADRGLLGHWRLVQPFPDSAAMNTLGTKRPHSVI